MTDEGSRTLPKRAPSPSFLEQVLNEVFKERNLDFSQYNARLLQRRLERRVQTTRAGSQEAYLGLLQGNREEMDALLDALTVNTTQFFRDPEVFEALQRKVIPEIFTPEVLEERKIVRIWSCGSSAGEEAASVLILIAEYVQEYLEELRIHIYGTDIDRWSIEKAKEGIYEAYEFKTMPRHLRTKYFWDMGNKRFWRRDELNPYLTFWQQDVINDEPLRQVDLILCRNLFIYFKPELQSRCLEKFAEALKKGGFLVLGLTESLRGGLTKTFEEFDRDHRIYRKRS